MINSCYFRVDAIRTAQEEREILVANRPNPLDEELIKTKGMLRAPSERNRRDSSKRNSKEIKELMVDITKSDMMFNDMDILKPTPSDSNSNVNLETVCIGSGSKILEDERHDTSDSISPVKSKLPDENSKDNLKKACKNELVVNMDKESGTLNDSIESLKQDGNKGKKSKDTVPSITDIETKKLTKLKTLNKCELDIDLVKDFNELPSKEHNSGDTNSKCSNGTSTNEVPYDAAEGEEFSLPKDFVASTVKGFETQCLQNSPEKGENKSVQRSRSKRTKQLHGESNVSVTNNVESTSNDISDVHVSTKSTKGSVGSDQCPQAIVNQKKD